MQTWLIFSLCSVVALAGSEMSQKISLTQKAEISAITNNFVVWTLQGIVGLLLALMLGQFTLIINDLMLWKLLLISLVYFAGGTLYYTSYKGNSPSISIIFGTISVVISSLLGTIFLNDTYTFSKVIGIILILSAIAFLHFRRTEKIAKNNIYALLGGLCFGIAFTLDKSMVTTISPFMYLGLMCLGVAVVSLMLSFQKIRTEIVRLKGNNFIPMFFSAGFGSSFNLFTFFAYRNGANVGIADAVNNTTVFLVILLEIFLLKDTKDLFRKVIGALVATVGVVLIGLFV